MQVDILIEVTGGAKEIVLLLAEHLKFTRAFRFSNGKCVKKLSNFPITTDNFFDFGILAGGIPNKKCEVKITIDVSGSQIEKEYSDLFDTKGWAIVRGKISLS